MLRRICFHDFPWFAPEEGSTIMYKHRITTAVAAGAACLALTLGSGSAFASTTEAPADPTAPAATAAPLTDSQVLRHRGVEDFTDNEKGSPYYIPVRWMQIHKLAWGYWDGSFGKYKDISRGESLAMIYRYLDPDFDIEQGEEEPFSDVDEDHTFYRAITWAEAEEVAYGYNDGEFKSDWDVTRGEFVSFLYRASGSDFTGDEDESDFEDVKTSNAHYDAIAWAAARGIVTGYEDENFRPDQNIVRAEVAKVLHYYAKTSR
jgi:hypothetical protein